MSEQHTPKELADKLADELHDRLFGRYRHSEMITPVAKIASIIEPVIQAERDAAEAIAERKARGLMAQFFELMFEATGQQIADYICDEVLHQDEPDSVRKQIAAAIHNHPTVKDVADYKAASEHWGNLYVGASNQANAFAEQLASAQATIVELQKKLAEG